MQGSPDRRCFVELALGRYRGVKGVVIVNTGMAKSLTTTMLRKGVHAFTFGQKGLMAGLGLQGSKIMEIHPN
jgi:hypothetical protein